jgi:hypothetical protein
MTLASKIESPSKQVKADDGFAVIAKKRKPLFARIAPAHYTP